MDIDLIKSTGYRTCKYDDCKRKPEFVDKYGVILKDTMCLKITVDDGSGIATAYYCRDCINIIWEKLKTNFNSMLWILH